MPAQGKRDVRAGVGVAEGGGDANGEEGGIVRLRRTGGVVIHQTYGGPREIGGGARESGKVILDGGCGWEDGGEGCDG